MKKRKDFIVRNIAGDNILVPIGETALEFSGLVTMNDVGVFIWDNLEKVDSEEELLSKILNEYNIDDITAKLDMEEFLDILKELKII